MKRTRIKLIVIRILTVLLIARMVSFSNEPAAISHERSGFISQKIDELGLAPLADLSAPARLGLIDLYVRKTAHFTEYFVLAILMYLSLENIFSKRKRMSWIFCTIIAVADESVQIFAAGRGPEVRDVMLDSTGALTGLAILCIVCYIITKRKNSFRH